MNYVEPEIKKTAFTCPFCNTYSQQLWRSENISVFTNENTAYCIEKYSNENYGFFESSDEISTAYCTCCDKVTIWLNDEMIFPSKAIAPLPIEDMPEDVKNDYLEARDIVNRSPKGASALLRLALQKLCVHLGGEGKNINKDIQKLVDDGLPVEIQQALDIIRVVGNNAVHPGEIDINDTPQIALNLFKLINMIVDNRIVQPKKIEDMFNSLPERALQAIEKRDEEK